jgi:hypothetical protein
MRASSVTGFVLSIPHQPIQPPGSCFCPQSARGRCLMGSDEDRSANLRTRSQRERCSAVCGLTGSIVPATGPPGGPGVEPARTVAASC